MIILYCKKPKKINVRENLAEKLKITWQVAKGAGNRKKEYVII